MSGSSWLLLGGAHLALATLLLVMTTTIIADALGAERWRRDPHGEPLAGAGGRLGAPDRRFGPAIVAVELAATALLVGLLYAVVAAEGWDRAAMVSVAIAVGVVALALLASRPTVWAAGSRAERGLGRWAGMVVPILSPVATALGVGERFVGRRVFRSRAGVLGGEPLATPEPAATAADEPDERAMIANVLRLERTTVREVMVPRVDVVAVAETAELPELLAAITGGGHSRLPVYRGSLDRIVGVLYAKDLLPLVGEGAAPVPVAELARPAYAVPESMRLDELLGELKRRRVHLAVVADEYGGTAGIVTIEDVLEEIVGEIRDEYDSEPALVERLEDGALLADGRLPIDEMVAALDLSLEPQAFETVAGLVHHHLGRMPEPGDRIEIPGLLIEVVEVEGHRLRQLRLDRRAEEGSAAEPTANGRGVANGDDDEPEVAQR